MPAQPRDQIPGDPPSAEPARRLEPSSAAPDPRDPVADDSPTIRRAPGSDGSGSRGGDERPIRLGAGLPGPGQRLDVFEVQEPIGVGGMGAVFRALDSRLDRLVALKVLPPEQAADPETVRRFYQEARAAARLDHENIARVYAIGHDKDLHFIAFEYIEGANIRQRVERLGPLPVEETVNFTMQIAGALVHAAERGVVHRDIKPSNLIVTPHGRTKLVDMGLARNFERSGGTDDGLTQSGMTLGTFDYISPEQARDPRDVDARSDLYSLGCTMFHMLTGQPPFPGGTVLQKLLSHRDEPAPDVRSLNPDVPADLAAVILKLMAKEPDRRYQSPELLLRDLSTLAGALGLRSVSPEGLVWMSPTLPPAWERHLFWGLPAALLVGIVGLLIWYGQPEPAAEEALALDTPPAVAVTPTTNPAKAATTSQTLPEAAQTKIVPAAAALPDAVAAPSSRVVRATDDLRQTIRQATPGSTLILADPGPYILTRPEPLDAPFRRDLTIRAARGVRPVIRPASAATTATTAPLLSFEDARVELDGLTFDLGGPASGSAIRADRVALTLRDCILRGQGRPAAIELAATAAAAADPRPADLVKVDGCQFDGGRVAFVARGPVELWLRDCLFVDAGPAVWFDNPAAGPPVAGRLWVDHVSFLAGADPVFRFDGTEALVRMGDSVVAPSLDGKLATLVAIDDPDRLDWSGSDNLYARVGTFLLPTGTAPGRSSIYDYASWADSAARPREAASRPSQDHVWELSDPQAALARGRLASAAFRLGPVAASIRPPGARRTPDGPIAPPAVQLARNDAPAAATNSIASPGAAANRPTATSPGPAPSSPAVSTATPTPSISPDPSPPMLMPPPESDPDFNPMPMPVAAASNDDQSARPATPPPPPTTTPTPDDARVADDRAAPIRTTDQFLERLRQLGPAGGVLTLAADADLTLPTLLVQGTGRLDVEAAAGPSRPLLRFRPKADDPPSATDWPALWRVRSGGLQLQGIDIVLEADQAPALGRWSAFALAPDASLALIRSTVTVQGPRRSAAVRVAGPDAQGDQATSSIRVTDSLLRCGDDVIDLASGRRLDLELTNTVVAADGTLVRGHGRAAGSAEAPFKVALRQVTALVAGGLVRLESVPGEPDLPRVEVSAREAVLGTGPRGGPLFRVDGQRDVEALSDRITWDGRNVAYHLLDSYRRDQSSQPGSLPLDLNRSEWERAVGRKEESPLHGDVLFERPAGPSGPSWTLTKDDVRLDPESPMAYTSPDLGRIPEPPPAPPADRNAVSPLDRLQELFPNLRLNR